MQESDLIHSAQLLAAQTVAQSGDASHFAQELHRQAAATATFLGALQASPVLCSAAILHNLVDNGLLALETVAAHCGSGVADLCRAYTQVVTCRHDGNRGKARARQRVCHFVAAYRNPELGLLSMAALWGRFLLIKDGLPAQRHQFAEDGSQVVLPLLEMLGMRALREELDLWLWRLYEPDALRLEQAAQGLFEQIERLVAPSLPHAQLVYRPPALQSQPHAAPSDALTRSQGKSYPALELSLLVEEEGDCYQALYWLHRLFTPVDGGVVDYLRGGRINGARALQTTVTVPVDHQRAKVTFHISTHAMEEVNRWGMAALYARDRLALHLPNAWWNGAQEGYAQIDSAASGSLPETLYVFSPQGQLFRFHRGCTVVDYAYHVHTDLADNCQRFYINDEVVEPATPLHHLDLVALEVDPRAPGPTQVWLNAAHTSRARNNIERFLKRRGLGADQGQRNLDQRRRELEEHYGFNLPDHRITQATVKAMRQLKLSRVEELLAEVAAGHIVADRILHPVFADEIIRQIRLPRERASQVTLRPHLLQIAQCCRPRPGEDIVGLPSRRNGEIVRLRVHRADCVRAASGTAPEEEQMALKWRLQPRLALIAQLEMTAHDEDGLLGDALDAIYRQRPRSTLHKVEAAADRGVARLRFNVEVESAEVLDEICAALRTLPGRTVVEVRQLRLPPSELEAALQHCTIDVNPYSRLPVNEQAMFFGRSQELLQIFEWLQAGAGNIWLLGQKRVGKTSLLLHLKNHYLRDRGFVLAFVDFQLLGNVATSNLYFEIANAVYNELQNDPRIGDLGAPLPAVFAHQPPFQLITYLRSIQSRLGANRLVLMLDEFSRTTDAYLQGELARSFFDEWRGLLQATAPAISYVTVFQQQSYYSLSQHAQQSAGDPSWHLMELGERLVLKSLGPEDVRRLIEWPMRNFLEYTPECVELVARLTGGNPFLIQAFCFKLTAQLGRADRRQVEPADIDAVRAEFMQPMESVFAHFLDMIRGVGHKVVHEMARLARPGQPVSWEAIAAAMPTWGPDGRPDKLRRTLASLTAADILVQPDPAVECWAFASLLFQEWLELNPG
jgi:GTP pyrophosphokinase